jgi:pyrroline-5-carboxylate reductase
MPFFSFFYSLFTAPLDAGVLMGLLRQAVKELAIQTVF